jgi:hypothetical protein
VGVTCLKASTCQAGLFTAAMLMKVECYVFCVYKFFDALEGHLKYNHQLPYEYK